MQNREVVNGAMKVFAVQRFAAQADHKSFVAVGINVGRATAKKADIIVICHSRDYRGERPSCAEFVVLDERVRIANK